jgi:hypothetical protein
MGFRADRRVRFGIKPGACKDKSVEIWRHSSLQVLPLMSKDFQLCSMEQHVTQVIKGGDNFYFTKAAAGASTCFCVTVLSKPTRLWVWKLQLANLSTRSVD